MQHYIDVRVCVATALAKPGDANDALIWIRPQDRDSACIDLIVMGWPAARDTATPAELICAHIGSHRLRPGEILRSCARPGVLIVRIETSYCGASNIWLKSSKGTVEATVAEATATIEATVAEAASPNAPESLRALCDTATVFHHELVAASDLEKTRKVPNFFIMIIKQGFP